MARLQYQRTHRLRLGGITSKVRHLVSSHITSIILTFFTDIVKGIIEGETRVIVSGMTMEEIFKERQVFKTKIIENVQSELDQFGLKM